MLYMCVGVHAYQPPGQSKKIIKQIWKESYLPVARALAKFPRSVCADIAWSLEEQLPDKVYSEMFEATIPIQTPAYHPFLPLCSDEFIKDEALIGYGEGLFLPECGFSERILPFLCNVKYVIADDSTYAWKYGNPPFDKIIEKDGVAVLLQSHLWHARMTYNEPNGAEYIKHLVHDFGRYTKGKDAYLVVWIDWETFGHHIKGYVEKFLIPMMEEISTNKCLKLCTPDEILLKFPRTKHHIPDGSWSATKDNPYPLWYDPRNAFHRKFWEMSWFAQSFCKYTNLLSKCNFSCQPWWSARGDMGLAKIGLPLWRNLFQKETGFVREQGLRFVNDLQDL